MVFQFVMIVKVVHLQSRRVVTPVQLVPKENIHLILLHALIAKLENMPVPKVLRQSIVSVIIATRVSTSRVIRSQIFHAQHGQNVLLESMAAYQVVRSIACAVIVILVSFKQMLIQRQRAALPGKNVKLENMSPQMGLKLLTVRAVIVNLESIKHQGHTNKLFVNFALLARVLTVKRQSAVIVLQANIKLKMMLLPHNAHFAQLDESLKVKQWHVQHVL